MPHPLPNPYERTDNQLKFGPTNAAKGKLAVILTGFDNATHHGGGFRFIGSLWQGAQGGRSLIRTASLIWPSPSRFRLAWRERRIVRFARRCASSSFFSTQLPGPIRACPFLDKSDQAARRLPFGWMLKFSNDVGAVRS